ncbi:MAG: hypothetical protein ACREBJ_12355, partial [Nitrosotalea sp.]
ILKAHNYGKLVSYRNQNKPEVLIKASTDACETCKSKDGTRINTKNSNLEDIPPTHHGCECEITIEVNTGG